MSFGSFLLMKNLEFGFGSQSWTYFEIGSSRLWTHNVLHCIQLLLRHLPFEEHTVYGLVRIFDSGGGLIYNQIYTAELWCDIQNKNTEEGRLSPFHFGSTKI